MHKFCKIIHGIQTCLLLALLAASQQLACAPEAANNSKTNREIVAILVPSMGQNHMQAHDETHRYFQKMYQAFDEFDVTLEVFKDWHLPAVLKDFIIYRVNKACGSDIFTDQAYITRVRKSTMLLAAAVPDQITSGVETGWRADHRILAAQGLAFKVLDYQSKGKKVYLIGLGIGGGQIVAGATRLLATEVLPDRSLPGALNNFAAVLEGVAPLFGTYSTFVLWGAKASKYAARAAEILHNQTFLWQAAEAPVRFYKEFVFHNKFQPKYLVDKLVTVATPVHMKAFTPDIKVVAQYYNLYGEADLKCRMMGNKLKTKSSAAHGISNLAVRFESGILPAIHAKLLNSTSLAKAIAHLHEHLENANEFAFGVPGKLIVRKNAPPLFVASKKAN